MSCNDRLSKKVVLQAELVDTVRRLRHAKDDHLNSFAFILKIVTLAIIVIVCLNMLNLGRLFAKEFKWYVGAFAKGNSMPGFRGPTMFDVALGATYFSAYKVLSSFNVSVKELNQEACKFLINMIGSFPEMSALNWSGSAKQLKQDQMFRFLCLNNYGASDQDRWDAWNSEDNAWRFLFRNGKQLKLSLAYTSLKTALDKGTPPEQVRSSNLLYMLYGDGGITSAVMKFTTDRPTLSVSDLMYELIGFKVLFSRGCGGAKWQALTTSAATVSIPAAGMMLGAATIMSTALPGFVALNMLLYTAGPLVAVVLPFYFMFHHPCPKPIQYSDDRINKNTDSALE
jgi:uncharacterized membrane protein YjfL (UPF0719 family)